MELPCGNRGVFLGVRKMERLLIEADDFKMSQSGIDGALFFKAEETCFPAAGWRDLTSTALEQWIPVVVSFAMRHTDCCDLPFFDGPYELRLARVVDDVCAAGFCNGKEVLQSREVDMQSLLRSFVKAVRRYNRFRHESGLEPVFTKELSILHDILT